MKFIIKKKLLNHIFKNGKKQAAERILIKSFKSIQKKKIKHHCQTVKLALINTAPIFRLIKLKSSKRKKKLVKEIPAFLSNYMYRISWSLKFLVKASSLKTDNVFSNKFKQEILLNAAYKDSSVMFKNEFQNRIVSKKKYFKHYRW